MNSFQRALLEKKRKTTTWNSWRGDAGESTSDSDDEEESSSSSLSSPSSSPSSSLSSSPSSSLSSIDGVPNDKLNLWQHLKNTKATTAKVAISSSKSSSNNPLGDGNNHPPTPWGKSFAKTRIINELIDPTSDIHLFIGQYTAKNFENVNFKELLNKYADNKYKLSLFRENMKRLLTHLKDKTGPFQGITESQKKNVVEPWYTSINNVSKAYSLLFSLLMNDTNARTLASMSVEEIWESDPHFKQYELGKFKEYHKNMVKRTTKRKQLIYNEYQAYLDDLQVVPKSNKSSRGYPCWDTHKASKMLQADEESGIAKELQPKVLWKSRKEYQDFPLSVFRKHIYQLRSKQLAAPFWQYKRNMNAKKKYEELDEMMKEWHNNRCNELIKDFDKMSLKHN